MHVIINGTLDFSNEQIADTKEIGPKRNEMSVLVLLACFTFNKEKLKIRFRVKW